jgi:anthranilate synthase component 2
MILVIDNYDSFTYNLVHLLGKLGMHVRVARNDAVQIDEIRKLQPSGIVLSPGPGRPEGAGVTLSAVRELGCEIPLLGVCLGHQGIGHAFGGRIVHAPQLMHGKTSEVHHHGEGLYQGVPSPFRATRYHSLVISPDGFPERLEVTARTADGVIMGVSHREYPIDGVQFHPESILTEQGERLIRNWAIVRGCV